MAVSHTADPQFDPGQMQLFVYLGMTLYFVRDNVVLNPTKSNFVKNRCTIWNGF